MASPRSEIHLPQKRDYWIGKLAELPQVRGLKPDFEYGPEDERRGSFESQFNYESSSKLRKLTGDSDFLLYATLVAAFELCLSRHTKDVRTVIGSPPRARVDGAITPNHAVLIIDKVDGTTSFRDFLLHVRENLLETYANQDYLFEPDEPAPFEVALVFRNIHSDSSELHSNIVISLVKTSEALHLAVSYNRTVFREETVKTFAEQALTLLETGLADFQKPIASLEMMSAAEREKVVVEWNRTTLEPWSTRSMHELIEQCAATAPDAIAFAGDRASMTYRELNERANQLAHCLRRRGVQPDDRVGLCTGRSGGMLIGILGILKAGGAYLPLDASDPRARLHSILEDAGAKNVVIQQQYADLFQHGEVRLLSLDDQDLTCESTNNPEPVGSDLNLAYVIYTSGSTGKPKGVLVTHRNVLHLLSARAACFAEAVTNFLLVSPLTFDASVVGIFWTLTQGGTLVVPDLREGSPPAPEMISRRRITHLICTPSLYQFLLEQPRTAETPSLRLAVVAGEVCSRDLVKRHFEVFPKAALYNEYGPTEATVWSTVYQCEPNDRSLRIPIGRPISDTQVYVLNEELEPAPIGFPGELYIAGGGVTRGYLNRPDLTAERFVPDNYSSLPGARLYRTGDLVSWSAEGNLEFHGRADNQVKVRGFRVELQEIESALVQHAAVREAAVVLSENEGSSLIAYISVPDGTPVDEHELRAFLSRKLPAFMLPQAIEVVNALPRLPSGKVDRRSLAAGAVRRTISIRLRGDEVWTPLQEMVGNIFAELLGIDKCDLSDDFFALGGHSLLAMRLVSRLHDMLAVDFPLGRVFEARTVHGIAAGVEEILLAGHKLTLPPITRVSRDQPLPLSFSQQRLWFIDRLQPGAFLFNVPVVLRFKGELDLAALEFSLNEIVRRHEVLRTTFVENRGTPEQVIHAFSPQFIPLVDLTSLTYEAREAVVRRLASDEARSSFDLHRGPLFRIRLLRLAGDEHVMLLTMHHIISDGWSTGVLVKEFSSHYEAYCRDLPSALPEPHVQYADYAWWQKHLLAGPALEGQLGYWRRQLTNIPPVTKLPLAGPRPAVQRFKGASFETRFPVTLTDQLRRLNREQGVTLFMTLLAGLAILFWRTTNQDDIVIGADVANRNRSEIQGLIGFFVNTLPMRLKISGNPTFQDFLSQVKSVALEAYMHQDVPLEMLVKELQLERNSGYSPLIQTVLVVGNFHEQRITLPGIEVTPLDSDNEMVRFDLGISVVETPQELIVKFTYRTDLFEREAIATLAGRYQSLLASIVAEPNSRIRSFDMLSATERNQQSLTRDEWQDRKRRKFLQLNRKTRAPLESTPVKTSFLSTESRLPLIIEPALDGLDPVKWIGSNSALINSYLLKHGAILFRGFDVPSISTFEQIAQANCPSLFAQYGDLPRLEIGGRIYSSTPYPADQPILFHNESSHLTSWPGKIWFHCAIAAPEGGETPLVDCRQVYSRLDPRLRKMFAEKQLLYVRNFVRGLDVSWEDFFHTDDRSEVEKHCHRKRIAFEWTAGGLRTKQIASAILKHPQSAEWSFFNQIQLHHVDCLHPPIRDALLSMLRPEDLPRNVYYGDGSPIESPVIDEIREIYARLEVVFRWRQGDILLLDNMAIAHGRKPFSGPRQIVVAMGEMFSPPSADSSPNGK